MKTVTRFVLENIYSRVVGGVFPPYWLLNRNTPIKQVSASDYDEISSMTDEELADAVKTNALGIPMVFPLQVKKISEPDSEYWTLPLEPIISITGKNTIVKRAVSKGKTRGTIKERWTQDDYDINIEGIVMNLEGKGYPEEDVRKLRGYCESASLSVLCPLFEIFSIDRIVIESFDFPFTSGNQNQNYKIKAVSDDVYKLLIDGDDLTKK